MPGVDNSEKLVGLAKELTVTLSDCGPSEESVMHHSASPDEIDAQLIV
jgi:hypothetical protein